MEAPAISIAQPVPRKDPADGAGAALVDLIAVGKVFSNGTAALADVDLTIRQGEFLSLLGPSGCGKSTILRLVAGLDAPTSGSIAWGGATDRAGHQVGFVFQEPTLMPWASVFDNVWLPLRLKGMPRKVAREKVMSALEQVELADFATAYPRELSGGMKMRVSIARALATDPAVLLMDEPFAALDEITRHRLDNEILRLWQRLGWTVVFVTHSVFESVYLSTRVAVMGRRPGRILAQIGVDEPFPRSDDFRTSMRFGELARTTSAALEAAMRGEDVGGAAAVAEGLS